MSKELKKRSDFLSSALSRCVPFLCLLVLGFNSCAYKKIKIKSLDKISVEKANEITQAHFKTLEGLNSFRVKASTRIENLKERYFFKQFTIGKEASLLMKIFKFSSPILTAYMSLDETLVYDIRNSQFYGGKEPGKVFKKLSGLDINSQEMLSYFKGTFVNEKEFEIVNSSLINTRYFVSVYSNSKTKDKKTVWIDSKTDALNRVIYLSNDKTSNYTVKFLKFFHQNGHNLPKRILFSRKDPFLEIEIKIKSYEVNPTLSPNLKLPVPNGVLVKPLEFIDEPF